MNNAEFYKEEIMEILDKKSTVALVNGELDSCHDIPCKKCDFFSDTVVCGRERIKWLISEHVEKPKLTEKEHMLCQILEKGWLVRGGNEALTLYSNKPVLSTANGLSFWLKREPCDKIFCFSGVDNINSMFPFIKRGDSESWSIEELLKLEVEE